ncbi:MAG: AAA family ATPase [Chlamydiia bacterium]|nr:AAA family ATPase [Chlamydiia bacterium]
MGRAINSADDATFRSESAPKDESVINRESYVPPDWLNDDQKKMVLDIVEYLGPNKRDLPYFTVQGVGGSGKTTSIMSALTMEKPGTILAATLSHAAKLVLSKAFKYKYAVTTLASMLKKTITYDENGNEKLTIRDGHRIALRDDNGEELKDDEGNDIVTAAETIMDDYEIFIIDEVSMVDDNTYHELRYHTKGKKLILLGDYAQLPPVSQDTESKFFDITSIELLKSMRFKGDINYLTLFYRDEIVKTINGGIAEPNILNLHLNRKSKLDDKGGGYVFIQKPGIVFDMLVKLFKMDKGMTFVRAIAYRNSTIDRINDHLRKRIYGEDAQQYEVGEPVISQGGYTREDKKGKVITQIYNGHNFVVTGVKYGLGPYDLKVVQLSLEDVDGVVYKGVLVLESTETNVAKYKNLLAKFKEQGKRFTNKKKAGAELRKLFGVFRHAYAISTHKVQGSTFKYAFVFEKDIFDIKGLSDKNKLQSMYVSVSRASYKLIIHHPKFKVDSSEITKELLYKDE